MNQALHPVFRQALLPFIGAAQNTRRPTHAHIVLAHALYDLNCIVNAGEEFPGAVYRKAQQYNVDQGALEALYDAQFQTNH